jgi:hypothetical protein
MVMGRHIKDILMDRSPTLFLLIDGALKTSDISKGYFENINCCRLLTLWP